MASQKRPAGQRSIRLRLAMVFVIPLVSLLALWAFAASVTLSNALQEHNFNGEDKLYGGAAQALGVQLTLDRQDAITWIGSHGQSPEMTMLSQFRATEKAIKAFRSGLQMSLGSIPSSARPALRSFEQRLDNLPSLHAAIQSGSMSAFDAFQSYNAITDAEFYLYSKLVYVNNVNLYQQSEASVQAGRSLEMALRAVALISGSLANGGHMGPAEHLAFAQSVANQRLLMGDALKNLNPSLGSGYRRAVASPAYKSFEAIEDKVMASTGSRRPIPVSSLSFLYVTATLFKDVKAGEQQDRIALSSLGTRTGDRLLLELLLVGGIGLLAVVLSIFLMARFARRTSRELRGLQGAALDLAIDRLPSVVERLSQGEEVDIAEETAPRSPARIKEIARVAEAIGTVQRMAVESAVGQARLRHGVSQVFRNLAWRSQSLLHRQLSLLDAMERKTTDPDALEELFRLDHLTTRMRRHAEGLIILSGAEPGRAWREPVPILDVLRGAIAEIEDYKRVNVITDAEDAIVGSSVADLIHLLAELIENATFYSPATTEVSVKAGRVANGFVVEIEDRGIGIGERELARINDRLANPPEFDPVNSDQLGLFVVARLAARHAIKITIRQSPYGGTAAVVLLPHSIVVARGRALADMSGYVPGWLPTAAGPAAIAPASWPTGEGAALRVEVGAGTDGAGFDVAGTGVVDANIADSGFIASVLEASVVGASILDAGTLDAGTVDAGTVDAGTVEAGSAGAGTVEAGTVEASVVEGGTVEAGTVAAGTVETSAVEASAVDVIAAGPVSAAGTPPPLAAPAAPAGPALTTSSGLPIRRKAGNGTRAKDQPSDARDLSRRAGGADLPSHGSGGDLPRRGAGPDLPRRGAGPDLPRRAVRVDPPAAAAAAEQVGSEPAAELPGLPRRVRQASLAPQLRDDTSGVTSEAEPSDPADGRSPEESRALVDALQFGWRRGLSDAALDDVWTPAASRKQAVPAELPDERSASAEDGDERRVPPRPAGEGD